MEGIHVKIEGSGPNKIVLLHGLTGSLDAFDRLSSCLSKHGKILRLDLPRHGLSIRISKISDMDPEKLAKVVWEVIDKTGFEDATIVTHSFSNMLQPFIPAKRRIMLSPPFDSAKIRKERLLLSLFLPLAYLLPYPADRRTFFDFDRQYPDFDGWMIASAPALNALDHARYDVWVMRCKTE